MNDRKFQPKQVGRHFHPGILEIIDDDDVATALPQSLLMLQPPVWYLLSELSRLRSLRLDSTAISIPKQLLKAHRCSRSEVCGLVSGPPLPTASHDQTCWWYLYVSSQDILRHIQSFFYFIFYLTLRAQITPGHHNSRSPTNRYKETTQTGCSIRSMSMC